MNPFYRSAQVLIITLYSLAIHSSLGHSATTYNGIALSGGDFGESRPLPGEIFTDYTYPTAPEIREMVIDHGMNTIRIPFLWERLQNEVGTSLESVDLRYLKEAIEVVGDVGASAIIGPHNYGRYYGDIVGDSSVTNSDFAQFWSTLATEFIGYDHVMLSLMNEPNTQDTEKLVVTLNTAIAAIRSAGAKHKILVPGNHWSGAHSWGSRGSDTQNRSNAEAMLDVVDPLDNIIFVAHQYLDGNNSGLSDSCVSQTRGSEALAGFTLWLRTYGKKGFLQEFAVANNPTCLIALEDMLTHVDANDDVYEGWTYWGGGSWWAPDYKFTIQPSLDIGTPQLNILKKHIASLNTEVSEYDPLDRSRVVMVSSNGDGFLVHNDTRQWVDRNCMSQLSIANSVITTEPWEVVSNLPESESRLSCDDIENLISRENCTAPRCSNETLIVVAIVSANGDGFLLFPDNTRQWISSECITTLTDAGVALTQTPWSEVGGREDTQTLLTCLDVLEYFENLVSSESTNDDHAYTVAIVSSNGDGYLLSPDGSRQWLSKECISHLSDTGIRLTASSWDQVVNRADTSSPLICSEIGSMMGVQ